jgi:hypothetical protein
MDGQIVKTSAESHLFVEICVQQLFSTNSGRFSGKLCARKLHFDEGVDSLSNTQRSKVHARQIHRLNTVVQQHRPHTTQPFDGHQLC